ncbi:hypothetical protein VZT92_012632 [Zoarces viviparus]|uniref:Uncharacterized protein n=1 Tax=Zoarces viviparus TaxID=48416 RepID=A0AAW1F2E0_ZOAVI
MCKSRSAALEQHTIAGGCVLTWIIDERGISPVTEEGFSFTSHMQREAFFVTQHLLSSHRCHQALPTCLPEVQPSG